jgi:Kef-type K+ transport system membrane component KefB/mannitol/fructose-specific phosphotransferase system IIA component (Ntr-type)
MASSDLVRQLTTTPAPACPPVSYAIAHDDSLALYAALVITLLVARLLGELARRLKQPAVLGELIAGIVLGKTLLGTVWPAAWMYLYGPSRSSLGFSAVTSFCVTLYMLVAGMEMNLAQVMQKKRPTALVGFFSMLFPLIAGFTGAVLNPELFGKPTTSSMYPYALFCGTALSITALPVAAKTLRDLHLYRTDMGSIVMGSATTNDLAGWCLFAIVLSLAQTNDSTNNPGLVGGIVLSICFVVFMLTVGRWVVNKSLPFAYAYLTFPGGVYGYVGVLARASASFARYVGLHNTLGGFLAGIAVGNSAHAKPSLRSDIDIFVSYVLAPLFFGSVCINANFVASFDISVVALVIFIGFLGKLLGGFLGAYLGKCTMRESLAIAVCMNARGAMELILANVALSTGVINGTMFVALVLLAIISSLIPGPLLRRILMSKETVPLASYMAPNGFVPELRGADARAVITELCAAAGSPAANLVMEREQRVPTGYPDQVAIPHALVSDIQAPVIVVGVCADGVDFKSRDESLSKVVILLLCPSAQPHLEQELLTRLTSMFSRPAFFDEVQRTKSKIELLAIMAIESYAMGNEVNAGRTSVQHARPALELRRHYSGVAEPLSQRLSEAVEASPGATGHPVARKSSSSTSSHDKTGPGGGSDPAFSLHNV